MEFEFAVQGGENPFLENGTAVGIHLAKGEAHALGGFCVGYRGFGFEVLVGMENFYENGGLHGERGRSLGVTAEEAEFSDAGGKAGGGRIFRGDFCGSVERKPETAAVLVHSLRGVYRHRQRFA
jgi:hypothetical protein